MRFKCTKVVQRNETVSERGKADSTRTFEDVTLEVVAGEFWTGSAAATPIGLTVDHPDRLGFFREGDVYEAPLTRV